MMHWGRNQGKKLLAVRILQQAFEVMHLVSGENPLQVLVNAIINAGPREDSTRIGRAGTVRRQAVDVSPMRRIDQAIYLLTTGAREAAFRNIKSVAECLADELMNAAKVSFPRFCLVFVPVFSCILPGPGQSRDLSSSHPFARVRPTRTPSRRRTSSSVWPSPTDNCPTVYCPFIASTASRGFSRA